MFAQAKFIFLIFLLVSTDSFANVGRAASLYQSKGNLAYRDIISELVSSKQYFAAIPWVKEALTRGRRNYNTQLDDAIDKIISVLGIKHFEILPLSVLQNSNSQAIKYIIAKKYFGQENYGHALKYAMEISSGSVNYPFALNLIASAQALQGVNDQALLNFKRCVEVSDDWIGNEKDQILNRQLITNRDYCTAGIARQHFAKKDFEQATLDYLDIEKKSYVWPEILFEEAWTSYHQRNYNRTLGKLITYKAPIFDHIYKPENEVLAAASYFQMCLYKDAKEQIETFFDQNMKGAQYVRNLLRSNRTNYFYFYQLIRDFEEGKRTRSFVLDNMMRSLEKDPVYLKNKFALVTGYKELGGLRKSSNNKFLRMIVANTRETIETQKKIIGAVVRQSLLSYYAELYEALQYMSQLKLEILAKRKASLYSQTSLTGKRGSVEYIQRNDKQYFWDYNGEFWADELGDYVFALASECK